MARIKLRYVNEFIDRHGKLRYYFRRPGSRSVPLPGLVGSVEFMTAYQAALASGSAPPPSSKHIVRGSLAIRVFSASRATTWAPASMNRWLLPTWSG